MTEKTKTTEATATSAADHRSLNIYQKLAAITGEVGAIAKGGENKEQHYAFIEYAAVAGELRGLFAKYGVVIVPNMPKTAEQKREELTSSYGKKGVNVLIDFTFDIINADAPADRFTVGWTGEAADYGDKATNKAATSALKYYLMRQFNISEKGEQEADANTIDRGSARPAPASNRAPAPAPRPQPRVKTVSNEQLEAIYTVLAEKGITALADGQALLRKMSRQENIRTISSANAQVIKNKIENADADKLRSYIGISVEPDDLTDQSTEADEPELERIYDAEGRYSDDGGESWILPYGQIDDDKDVPDDATDVNAPTDEPTPVKGPKVKPVDDKFKTAVRAGLDALNLDAATRLRLLKDTTGKMSENSLTEQDWRNYSDAIDELAIAQGDAIAYKDETGQTDNANNTSAQ